MKYHTSVAFRTAPEDRLKAARQDGVGLARFRKRVVFERLQALSGGDRVAMPR